MPYCGVQYLNLQSCCTVCFSTIQSSQINSVSPPPTHTRSGRAHTAHAMCFLLSLGGVSGQEPWFVSGSCSYRQIGPPWAASCRARTLNGWFVVLVGLWDVDPRSLSRNGLDALAHAHAHAHARTQLNLTNTPIHPRPGDWIPVVLHGSPPALAERSLRVGRWIIENSVRNWGASSDAGMLGVMLRESRAQTRPAPLP